MSGEPIVSTRLGKLRGSVQRSIVGDDYLSFKGIPYAKPPVGQLRFEVSTCTKLFIRTKRPSSNSKVLRIKTQKF